MPEGKTFRRSSTQVDTAGGDWHAGKLPCAASLHYLECLILEVTG
jgi:hypothetical protein